MEDADLESHLTNLFILADQFFIGFPGSAIVSLIILIFLVAASGLISGSETAFFSLTPLNLEALRTSNSKRDVLILKLRDKPKTLLATILIANNFVNVSIVILSTFLVSQVFNMSVNPILGRLLEVIGITSVILLFGEIMPKIMANKEPLKISGIMALPLKFLIAFFRPFSYPLVRSTSMIDRRLSKKGSGITMSDISDAIDLTVDENAPQDEKMILKGIATFGEIEASEIMESRVNVTAIDSKLSFGEMMKVVIQSGFSRIPVYKESFDNVLGVLYIKDLLPYVDETEKPDWKNLVRPAFFVPENKRINDLLQEFKLKKIHLAIVVDEYGGTSGIITLEDIIEEIVGEISDEFDKEDQQYRYRKTSANTYVFEAKTLLNDLCKILEIEDDYFDEVKGESDSLGGLILELKGEIPATGTKIIFDNFEFTIKDADQRKINEVGLKIKTIINS